MSQDRRARERRLRQTIGHIDRGEVFARDKNICQLCKTPIDMTKQCPDPLAPTLDHIVPLGRGGIHHMDNLQAAHYSCNMLKADDLSFGRVGEYP